MKNKTASKKKEDGKQKISHSHSKAMRKKKSKKEIKEKREIDFSEIEEKLKQAEKAITHSDFAYASRDITKLRETLNDEKKEIKQKAETEEDFFEPVRQLPIQEETRAPVLERIIQSQEPIMPMQQFTNQQEEREERRIDYSAQNQPNYGFERNTKDKEEKKYESSFVPPILLRREISGSEIRQEFLRPREETWQKGTNEQQLGEIDVIMEEARLPFEEQKKYKRHKLR